MYYAIESELDRARYLPLKKMPYSYDTTLDSLTTLTNDLAFTKPCTTKQRDIIEKIIAVSYHAGDISAVKTIESLGRALLWVGSEYVTPFAKSILILEKKAITENANDAFSALEQTLMVCYCKILTKTFYSDAKISANCTEWQRHFFLNIVNAIETTPYIDPVLAANTLKLSGMITSMNNELRDISKRIDNASDALILH